MEPTRKHPWLHPGWKILPTMLGYCSNTNYTRRFRRENNCVQPQYYRARQAEPCHQLERSSRALSALCPSNNQITSQQSYLNARCFAHCLFQNPPSVAQAWPEIKHIYRAWTDRKARVNTSELRRFTGPRLCVLTICQPMMTPFSCLTLIHFEIASLRLVRKAKCRAYGVARRQREL